MELLINDSDLALLLEKKRDEIGYSGIDGYDVLFSGATFLVSALFSEYGDVGVLTGNAIWALCVLLAIVYTAYGGYIVYKRIRHKYDHEQLCADIEALDQVKHRFSIVAIKDTFNDYPNRFLLYYDKRWDCKFFFNYKTTDAGNEENIKARLSNELKIEKSAILVEKRAQSVYKKFSVSAEKTKVYEHTIYYAELTNYDDLLRQDEFEIQGKHCYWMTISEMEQDEEIQKKNLDVVQLVKDNVP